MHADLSRNVASSQTLLDRIDDDLEVSDKLLFEPAAMLTTGIAKSIHGRIYICGVTLVGAVHVEIFDVCGRRLWLQIVGQVSVNNESMLSNCA
jgi:hypothetical protein